MPVDPRGPFRTVASVECTPEANLTTFAECGHVGRLTSHHSPAKPGDAVRCFACGPYGHDAQPATPHVKAAR